MSEERRFVEVTGDGPSHLGWRSRLLAELALARVPELTVFKDPPGQPYAFVAATRDGLFFQIDVRAYSSVRAGVERVERIPEIRFAIPAEQVRQARESFSPVVVFLFDADFDHGRYARLDTLPPPEVGAAVATIPFPIANLTDPRGIRGLAAQLRTSRAQPAASTAA